MKERVTLTIEQNILNKVDNTVDGFKVKNRSHAVEMLLVRALGSSDLKTAFVLAGGKGTRFKPITEEIPKPMIPLQGKPLLQHTIDLLRKYGITHVIISLGYKGDKIKEYFGDGSRFGVRITYVEEEEPQGTAGPLRLAKDLLKETFVMCNADELKEIDLLDMYLFHKEHNAVATIALTTVDNPSAYGVAKLQGNKIYEFIEKPINPPSNFINSGLYILEPVVLGFVPKEGFAMIEKDVFPQIAKKQKLVGYPFTGYWRDLGNMDSYAKAIEDLKTGKLKL